MNRIFKFLGVVAAALTLGAFAVPGIAAPAKIFGLVMSPSTVTSTSVSLTAKYSNLTPNGNSVINTVVLSPPADVTITGTSFPNGGSSVSCPATTVNSAGQTVPVPPGSICVSGIPSVMKAGCSPTACSWSFNLTATLPNACGVKTWSGQGFAGNSFNGDVFEYQPGSSSVTTTINTGCTYNVNVTLNPTGGGTASCSPNPVTHGGSSTCTASAGAGFSFSGFSGDCTGATCVLTSVTSIKNVTANFAHLPNTVTTAVTGSGTLACTPNPVPWDTSTTCTATPGPGYGFVNFIGDCSGTNPSCTLNNVQSAKSVTANFAQNAITATASPAAGGSVTCTPNPVPYNGNSSCTATANPFYAFAGFSGDCSGPTCSFTNVTSTKNVTASFVAKTLAIQSPPTSAAVGEPFDVVVGVTPGPTTVTVSAGCDATATLKSSTTTAQTWTIKINQMPATGTCTITFSSPDYQDVKLDNLKVYKGVLFCGDYDSVNGPGDPSYDPDALSTIPGMGTAYVGTPGWGLRRGPNKDGSPCVKINYSCDLNAATNIASCVWDKDSGQQATFKYLFLWTPKPPVSGWTEFRPWVSWGIASPAGTALLPDWVPILSCDSDTFSTPPTAILPIIPAVLPFTDPANIRIQYQPNGSRQAMVCLAGTGWTAVGTPGNPSNQMWHIVIDEADLKVSGP